ncbi:zinc-binding protein A33-like [Salarias fasciatus]|uniref:Zinc-binding protein A33-like n=1 Tax=Salarias fasciatus TaxID=181472 RepID=A0A672FQY6_SALFA|nr:zinc-binding protein A33-like [Salarias fasciatus]
MASKAPQPEEDCICPICCELFTDPVVLLCGHSFCTYCVTEWWKQSRIQTCPVCKDIFPMPRPPRNLALRNLSDAFRREKIQAASESKALCSLHGEKLKLFCQDDQQPICLICRDAKEHKKHNCVPVNEAAEESRGQLKVGLMHLKTSLGTSERAKARCEGMASHIELQAQQTEQSIKAQFQKVYQLLHEDEARRINALRKEAKLKREAMKARIEKWNAEILSLREKVQTIEKQINTEDILLVQNIKSTKQRLQHKPPDDENLSGALIDQAKHLGNLQFSIWKNIPKNIECTPVILDPNTASCDLNVSTDLTSVTKSDKYQPFPDNPERLGSTDILGYKGFSSGKHSWDVEVSGYWAVGVTVKTTQKEYERIWGIYMCVCTGVLRELKDLNYVDEVSVDKYPKKIRVVFDYNQGLLSFFDLDRRTHVHTVKDNFTETLFPYFRDNVRILKCQMKS